MKKLTSLLILIILFIGGIQKKAYSQYNPFTNCYNCDGETSTSAIDPITNITKSINGIPCNPNSFFGITRTGTIDELSLVGNTITYTSTILTGGGASLAYCNNLNGGAFTPTFYSTDSATLTPKYYNGTAWVNLTGSSIYYNTGGKGNNLYFQALNSGFLKRIDKYDGTNYTTIYNNKIICVADLAVDSNGNVWFPTKNGTPVSDSINVISPTGQLIKQFAFAYNCNNAYGAFILNNVYYIGLGANNPTSPNTLLPVTFTSNTAIIGTPISMPLTNYVDFESCNQGLPLLVINENKENQITISPNPFTSQTTISFSSEQNNTIIKVINVIGEVIQQLTTNNKQLTLDMSGASKGIYFAEIIDANKNVVNKKIVVQ